MGAIVNHRQKLPSHRRRLPTYLDYHDIIRCSVCNTDDLVCADYHPSKTVLRGIVCLFVARTDTHNIGRYTRNSPYTVVVVDVNQ